MRCGSSIVFPLIVILIGAFLLAQNLFPELSWLRQAHLFWPVLLILWGVAMLSRRTGWRNL